MLCIIYEQVNTDVRIKISSEHTIAYYCFIESTILNRLMMLKEGLGGCSFKRTRLSAAPINADLFML